MVPFLKMGTITEIFQLTPQVVSLFEIRCVQCCFYTFREILKALTMHHKEIVASITYWVKKLLSRIKNRNVKNKEGLPRIRIYVMESAKLTRILYHLIIAI